MPNDPTFLSDLQLARRIIDGSEIDWHTFVDRYTPLIRSVLRRYVHDDDDVGNLWADILARLRSGLLAQFAGRSSLATWLVLVARSAAVDHLRRQRGRRRMPNQLDDRPEYYRDVFRELFIRGRGRAEVAHGLRQRGILPPEVTLAEVLVELEQIVGDDTLQRVAWDLQADRAGAVSGRLLAYLEHSRAEATAIQGESSPERRLLQAEARRTLARVTALVDQLPDVDRRVLRLRFRRGWSARRIAESLHLRDQREVYTITERAIRSLRKLLGLSVFLLFLLSWSRPS